MNALALTICSNSPLVIKILGPTAEYIGDSIKTITQKQAQNLQRIFSHTAKKLDKQGILTGAVPPRILKHILDEGSYVENELAAEYFSGVLAASKSEHSRDDRALTILKILSSMSIYEIRLHYILYCAFRDTFLNSAKFNITNLDQAIKYEIFFPASQFISSFIIEKNEDINTILEHAIPGLAARNLIGTNYSYGDKDFLKPRFQSVDNDGIIASPSLLGAQVFLAAHGYLNISANKLCDVSLELELWDEIQPPKDLIVTRLLVEETSD